MEDFLEGEISEGEGESTDGEVTLDADSRAGGIKSSGERERGGRQREHRKQQKSVLIEGQSIRYVCASPSVGWSLTSRTAPTASVCGS